MKMGRPHKDASEKKTVNTRIRMTIKENQMLEECAKHLKTTKAGVLMTGLNMVYDDIQSEKKSNGTV